jgi:TM2 domain-containing membrane protein YozV
MNGLGNFLYFIMIWAGIGAILSFGGSIWLLYWALNHVSLTIS